MTCPSKSSIFNHPDWSFQIISRVPKHYVMFLNKYFFLQSEVFIDSRQTPKLEVHPWIALYDCLLYIFAGSFKCFNSDCKNIWQENQSTDFHTGSYFIVTSISGKISIRQCGEEAQPEPYQHIETQTSHPGPPLKTAYQISCERNRLRRWESFKIEYEVNSNERH